MDAVLHAAATVGKWSLFMGADLELDQLHIIVVDAPVLAQEVLTNPSGVNAQRPEPTALIRASTGDERPLKASCQFPDDDGL